MNNLGSKIPILRPPFRLPKSGLIREVVLISNIISKGKYHFGLGKTGLNSEAVIILGRLNSDVLLYLHRQCYIPSFKVIGLLLLVKKIFLRFLPYIGIVAMLDM